MPTHEAKQKKELDEIIADFAAITGCTRLWRYTLLELPKAGFELFLWNSDTISKSAIAPSAVKTGSIALCGR